ncbi:MAG: hypothetical protein JWN29_1783 [Acidimicrobiales bacterium]|nr:hypothetical protein [Acidimicrobiales bacterium]
MSFGRRGLLLLILTTTTLVPSSTTAEPAPTAPAPTAPVPTPTTLRTVPPTTATASATPPVTPPPILWSARHDGGTTSEWSSNGGGGLFNSGTNEAVVSSDHFRSGSNSLRASIRTRTTRSSGVRAFRWKEARENRDAFYSVWLYLPAKLNPTGSFLNLFQFKSRSGNGARNDPVWAFYGVPDGAGGAYLRAGWGWGGTPLAGPTTLDRGVTGRWYEPAQRVSLPVGRWVHLEAFLHQSSEFDGRLQFWQDGVRLFDLNDIRTSFKNCNYNSWCADNEWSVNLYADRFIANPTLYIDDAVISRSYIP